MISARLSTLSCSREVFLSEAPIYPDALEASEFDEKLQYKENILPNKIRARSRKVIWFNPPFSQIVKTNVVTKFLGLIDKHFKYTTLGKYFI